MYKRALELPVRPVESFFVWGPWQAGKSSLVRATYPEARVVDLLRTEEYLRYLRQPELLREDLGSASAGSVTIVDEVNRVPALLGEIGWLIENRGLVFALPGSNPRRLRRGYPGLLGGRARRYELFGLVSREVGDDFDLSRFLNHGYLPPHHVAGEPGRLVRAWVAEYLKEGIGAAGLVRQLPSFATFLWAAARADTELVNFTNVARDTGVSANTVREYYQILVDTMVGRFLPAFTWQPKRRVILTPKFYFADVGVVNHLARRGKLQPKGALYGKALENYVFHELTAYLEYRGRGPDLWYWRLASGMEVDFVVGDRVAAIDVKATEQAEGRHFAGLNEIREDQPGIGRRILVCLERRRRVRDDGIEVLPVREFLERLWGEEYF